MCNLVESCDYGDSNDRIIRDVLIIGCNSDKAKDKIVRQGEKIKLQEVIEILQLEDSTRQTLTEMNSTMQKINYVSYEKKKSKGNKNKQKFQNNSNGSNSSSSGQKQTSTGPGKQCYRCKKPFTQGHEKVCKALKAKCDGCGIVGHYQIACRKSGNFPQKANSNSNSTGRMNVAAAVRGTPSEADFFNEQGLLKEYQPNTKNMNVLSGTSSDKPIMIEFGCGLTPLSFDRKLILQVDTGADANAINKKTFDQLFPEVELEKSTFILKNFDERLIKPIGSFRCFLRWKGHKYRVQIEVMGADTPNILSRETTFLMGILKKCFITEKLPIKQNTPNSTLIPGPTAETTDPSTEGVFCHSVPPAQVPSMEGVFSHSALPTEAVFCHSVMPAEGNSPNPSTEAVFCHSVTPAEGNSPNPSTEATTRSLNFAGSSQISSISSGAKVFTIVHMDKGYWQVVLHPDSRKYTCMAFDIGRYQFKRLPMGSKVASDIFQRMLDSVYIGLPGVTGIADDMVIFGRNEEEHDRNLIVFLETTRKNGLVINTRKLQFKKEEVSFFGHRWNSTGISPDPKKTESILRMEFPPDKETMHSFLGLVNFLNRYTPRLAELCSPLRKLILKDSHYSPGNPEHAAFSAIKAEFKKKLILPYFDRNKETILQTDATKKGFGAVILQEEQPIY